MSPSPHRPAAAALIKIYYFPFNSVTSLVLLGPIPPAATPFRLNPFLILQITALDHPLGRPPAFLHHTSLPPAPSCSWRRRPCVPSLPSHALRGMRLQHY